MNTRRILAIGKLLLLFGTPLALVLGLFSCGVYCGAQNRGEITRFERDWLGLDVELPAEPSAMDSPFAKKIAEALAKLGGDKPEPAKPEPAKPEPAKPEPAKPEPTTPEKPEPTTPQPIPPVIEQPEAPAPTRIDPLAGDLATKLGMPVVVRVKVLVDDELIAEHPDWIDYVQRTVAAASQTYEKQFGITLELTSVGRWSVATAGLDSTQLLDDVRSRSREGNDVLVGFTNRPIDDRTAGKADRPAADAAYNGAYGVVYATPGHHDAHLRTLMHELGHVFGAEDITDPTHAGFIGKSFMSYAPTRESESPWIDADNRARIIERKGLPFIAEPEDAE